MSTAAFSLAGKVALTNGSFRGISAVSADTQLNYSNRVWRLPDLTLVLELPVEEAMERASARDADRGDRIGARSANYHNAVAEAFQRFAAAEPGRIRRVDAGGDPHVVHARIRAMVEPLLIVTS